MCEGIPTFVILDHDLQEPLEKDIAGAYKAGRHLRVNESQKQLVVGLLGAAAIEGCLAGFHRLEYRSPIGWTVEDRGPPGIDSIDRLNRFQAVYRAMSRAPKSRPDLNCNKSKSLNNKRLAHA
jgi:hypothetical protein